MLGLAATCYVIGLLVTSMYLNSFGVTSSVGLFRLSYLTAGMWTLAPIFASFVVAFCLMGICSIFNKKFLWFNELFGYDENALFVETTMKRKEIAVGLILLLLLSAFSWFQIQDTLNTLGLALGAKWFGFMRGGFIAATYVISARVFAKRIKEYVLSLGMSVFFVAFGTLLFLSYLSDFAKNGYGEIPAYLGGGKPKKVHLILDAKGDTAKQLSSMGLSTTIPNQKTDIELLYATESEYIFLVKKKETVPVTVKRDLVQAISYVRASQ